MKNKKGFWQDYLGYIILGLIVFAILAFFYLILTNKLSVIDYIKNLFRFRG